MHLTFVYAQKWNARHPNIIQHESTDSGETQPFKWLMMMMMIEPPKLLHVFSTSVSKSYFVYLLNAICLFSELQRDVWEVEKSLITYLGWRVNLISRNSSRDVPPSFTLLFCFTTRSETKDAIFVCVCVCVGGCSKALENVNLFVPRQSQEAVQMYDSSRCFPPSVSH